MYIINAYINPSAATSNYIHLYTFLYLLYSYIISFDLKIKRDLMASNSAIAIVVILTSFMFGCSLAATVVVGGAEGWRYGYNYTDWSLKHGPFYINDTLGKLRNT